MTRKLQARTLATRDRLMAAGREVLATSRMAGLRTDEVVLRAGTAKGTFFAHFPDRDHFLAALLAERLTVDFAGMRAPADRVGMLALLERLYEAFAADADTITLLARFSGPAGAGLGMDLMICSLIERLAQGIGQMQAQGQVGNPAAPEVLAEAAMALVVHAAASAQCPAHGEQEAVRARSKTLLHQMTGALLWPGG
jgi:AcrR family transcriptional regulator